MPHEIHFNHLAVITAAISSFVLGGIWYGPLFGKLWMEAAGVTAEQTKNSNKGKIFGVAFLLSLIQAYNLAAFIGPAELQFAVFAAVATGAGWVATSIGILYLFEMRSLKHFLINAGYMIVAFTLMGIISGAWK